MNCPKCGLLNPEGAVRCDCGYDFPSQAMKTSYLTGMVTTALLASLGARLAGQVLDALVAVIGGLIVIVLFAIVTAVLGQIIPAANAQSLTAAPTIFGAAFIIVYLLFADGLSRGQSLGKRVMKTSVVDETTGEPCTFTDSLVRNFLLMALGIIDWVFIFGKKRQRLGDKLAKTIVIRIGHV